MRCCQALIRGEVVGAHGAFASREFASIRYPTCVAWLTKHHGGLRSTTDPS